MATAAFARSLTIGGISIARSVTRTNESVKTHQITLPAGTAGTLSTRTDDDTGVVTSAGHGLIVGDKVDVHWGTSSVRYGMEVSSINANDVTVGTDPGHVGAGDAFPVQGTAVVITKQVSRDTEIDGDNASIIGVDCDQKAHIDFQDSGAATVREIDLKANDPDINDIDGGQSNLYTGNIIETIKATNGSTTAATLTIVALTD